MLWQTKRMQTVAEALANLERTTDSALFRELGPQAAGQALAASWHQFLKAVEGTVTIERRPGLEAAREAYLATLAGTVDPAVGIVIEP